MGSGPVTEGRVQGSDMSAQGSDEPYSVADSDNVSRVELFFILGTFQVPHHMAARDDQRK